jgi:hypothetical protein
MAQLLAGALTLIWATRSEVRLGSNHIYLAGAGSQFDDLANQCREVQAHAMGNAMNNMAVELRLSFDQSVASLTRGGNVAELYKGIEHRAELLTKLDAAEDAVRVWWLTVGMHMATPIPEPVATPPEQEGPTE